VANCNVLFALCLLGSPATVAEQALYVEESGHARSCRLWSSVAPRLHLSMADWDIHDAGQEGSKDELDPRCDGSER
jgi:hypothetical protein